ncbi:PREDICTED: uncharacterized protein LOC109210349 [Nicotiana attenuata]|uniref:uncharacterized protein LOC109210349 n=1 Tax=Nicotiana attenuata TaxID=49451 RepID=UPI000904B4D8|nr:PREDICTED: uncharacterized protein LOC109210349 [Nicotiana attenuata]
MAAVPGYRVGRDRNTAYSEGHSSRGAWRNRVDRAVASVHATFGTQIAKTRNVRALLNPKLNGFTVNLSQRDVGEQNSRSKQTAMKALLNTKMAEGSSIRDHVLKMMSLLNELEVLGAVIDKESQVEMVLQTLPNSF